MSHNLVDIGANLTHDGFSEDLHEVVQEAINAGVTRIVLTGSSEQGSIDALNLASQWPDRMYATAGVHPHNASDYSNKTEAILRDLLMDDRVVAVGECGLDYFRNFSPKAAQQDAFEKQLQLAIDSRLPLFLHQRDSHEDFTRILSPAMGDISRAVAHCFTGSADELDTYLEMGLYIGITGWICDERRGSHLQQIVDRIPPDRLMIETDAPYLLPRSLTPKPKSRRNEPKYLTEVLRVVAGALGQPVATVAKQTTENAERFFAI